VSIPALGDDRTDEDLSGSAPAGAWAVKVGAGPLQAGYRVPGPSEVRALLARLAGGRRRR